MLAEPPAARPRRPRATASRSASTASARCSASWYEFFPRSEGARATRTTGTACRGTFADGRGAAAGGRRDGLRRRLPAADPPDRRGQPQGPEQHPRRPGPDDPGSPWAIGSDEGGHDAIHPDLGTLEDFDAFVAGPASSAWRSPSTWRCSARRTTPGCNEHPEWFTTRADGTIAYAENPPKKYQDIYPLNFDNDPEGIYAEVLRVVRHWMDHGVRIFRVDNPHTKPVAFWEWLIGEVRKTDPDVLFLAEAFTQPADDARAGEGRLPPVLHLLHLAQRQVGARGVPHRAVRREPRTYMRPNFFVNTPDILHAYLQYGGPAGVQDPRRAGRHRSPTWGVYSGFELFEHVAVRPGSEEYLDSEKYQYRPARLGRRRGEGRSAGAVPHPAQRDPPRPPGPAAACAT